MKYHGMSTILFSCKILNNFICCKIKFFIIIIEKERITRVFQFLHNIYVLNFDFLFVLVISLKNILLFWYLKTK